MNVLSLFDGMGCLYIAMMQAGIKVDKYYSSEIDKYANAQTKLNIPGIIQLGDVRHVDVSTLDHIDFVGGGSPCQSFSFAGKRKGMVTKCEIEITSLEQYLKLKEEGFEFEGQSYLFWEYMRILTDIRKYNPDVKFLLENVEMVKKWERVLSEAIGVFGVHINSAMVSAQNRERIYWTNIRTKQVGLFGELHSDIPQPKDRGILLRDILEPQVDEKYYLSDKMLQNMKLWKDNGSGVIGHSGSGGQKGTIFATDHKMGALCATDYKQAKQICINDNDYLKLDRKGNLKEDQNKASSLTIGGHGARNHSDMDVICVAMVGRKLDENGTRKDDSDIPLEQYIEPRGNGKSSCLTGVQKDTLILYGNSQDQKLSPLNGHSQTLSAGHYNQPKIMEENVVMTKNYLQWDGSGNGNNSQAERAYYEDVKGQCLGIGHAMMNPHVLQKTRIRRLTPTECARLQTIPEWYKWNCSDTQQYRMLGNGWNINTIVHILSFYKV